MEGGVIEQTIGAVNYVARMSSQEKTPKICHVNSLKPYYRRQTQVLRVSVAPTETVVGGRDLLTEFREAGDLNEICFEPDIPAYQQKHLFDQLQHNEELFSPEPGRTAVTIHVIATTDASLI